MVSNCTNRADRRFGPVVGDGCRDGFDFTLLFEQAILSLVPAAIFILIFPIRFVYLTKRNPRTQSGRIRIAKLAAAATFAGLQLALLVQWSLNRTVETEASIAAAAINLVVAIQLAALSWIEHSRSVRPSTLLSIYLLFTIFFDLPQARTLWLQRSVNGIAGVFSAGLVLRAMLLVLEILEKRPYLMPNYRHLSPEATSGIINRSFMWWVTGIFHAGFSNLLQFDDLYVLDEQLTSAELDGRMQRAWNRRRQPERRLEFPLAVCRALIWPLLTMAVPRLFLIGFTFAQPYLFQRILTLLSEPLDRDNLNKGYALIVATAIIYLGLAILKMHCKQLLNRFTTMFRGAAVTLIYNRALLVQDGLYDESAAVTLMSTDVDVMSHTLTALNESWALSIEVVVGIYLLASQLGWVCVVPLVTVAVSFLGIKQIAKRMGGQQKQWADAVQKRIAITSSMLSGIRSIKMMGLSGLLTEVIQDQRVEEINQMKGFRWSLTWQNVVQNIPWAIAPALTFIAYTIQASIQGTGHIDTAKAFTSLSIITLLTDPVAKLLSTIAGLASTVGSIDRIQNFLIAPPKTDRREFSLISTGTDSPTASGTTVAQVVAVKADAVNARPVGALDAILRDITFEVETGSIAMVIGPVASGKSTLLKTILGETIWDSGSITVASQRIAFCSQLPWLPSTSIKRAICGPFNDDTDTDIDLDWYHSVLRACALEHDVSQLVNGDSTRLGSGSTVLSGGQKQRVALARAVYSRAEIILLDDVLSALDRKTQKTVVESLFGTDGLVRKLGSTVILATHATQFLAYADKVLVLEGGSIKHQGTYEKILHSGVSIAIPSSNSADEAPTSKLATLNAEQQASHAAEANEITDLTRKTGDRAVYEYYFKSVGWTKFLPFFAFAALHVSAISFGQIWLKWWTDNKVGEISLFAVTYVLLGVLNVLGILGYAWSMMIVITPTVATRLHHVLLKTVMRAPQTFFSATDTGAILNRFSQDMSLIETPLTTGVIVTTTHLLSAAAEAALIAAGSTYMAITIPFLIMTIYVLQHVYLRTSRQLRLLDLETRSPLYSHFLESLDGLATIRAFCWVSDAKRQNHKRLDVSQRPYYLMSCIQTWLELVLDLIVAAEAVTVVGLAMGLRSSTSAGLLGVSLNNILSFNGSLFSVVSGWVLLETSLGSIARIRSFEIEVKPEDKAGEDQEPFINWPSEGQITFRNVTASHNPTAVALKDISLSIKPGQKVGICGRTGSGKSSLVATILRMLEIESGSITVDGIDLATIPRETIRERLLTVPQDAPVLLGSIRLNVDPHAAHTDAEVKSALERVHLGMAVAERGGLEAEITQSSLSQGQRQLLALARAMLSKSKILLLDEPTSNVDNETDELIQEVLREEFKDCTVLTVAHRINTIYPGSDLIVVVHDGHLAEVGSPEELLKTNGRFCQLVNR